MWGGTENDDAIGAIHKAYDLGVTTIDTAPVYGFGLSEELVAKAVAGNRANFQLLTKYCLKWGNEDGALHFERTGVDGKPVRILRNGTKESIVRECEDSLTRLGTDYIDLYQQHWPVPETPIEETLTAVDQLLKDGKIRYAGVCNFDVELIEEAMESVDIVSVQPPYSLVNRRIEHDVLPFCHVGNIGVVVYSPLQRGILTGKISVDHEFPESDHRGEDKFFRRENRIKILEFLEKIRPIAERHNATLAQIVISWTIRRPGITAALVGARNPTQAEENARAVDIKLSEEETNLIDKLSSEIELEK